MKKVVYSLILSSLVVSNAAALNLNDSAQNAWDTTSNHIAGHKLVYSGVAVAGLTTGVVVWDLLKNDGMILQIMGLATSMACKRLKTFIVEHPYASTAVATIILTGGAAAAEVCFRGENSLVKNYYNKGCEKISGFVS